MTGPQLKSLRQARGLSRADLAAQLGISPRTLEGIEQGRFALTATLAKLVVLILPAPSKRPLVEERKGG